MDKDNRSLLATFKFRVFLSEGHTQEHKAYDADADDQNPAEFLTHFLTSFLLNFVSLVDLFPALREILLWAQVYPKGSGFVKKKLKKKLS